MATEEAKLALRRTAMVKSQLRGRGILNRRVLEAFSDTPREVFLPHDQSDFAYEDRPLSIGAGQTISQPYVVALMVQELNPQSEDRVLDVGAGSGYQTAILSRLCRHVYALERLEELTERAIGSLGSINITNATVCTGDGSVGWPEEAPFDGIICGAAAPDVPQAWIDQLADGGRIVVPVGAADQQVIVAIDKLGHEIRRREICCVRFVRLIGQGGWPG